MTNGVHATDLNGVPDLGKQAGRRDANNLALADQIQFSSILRTLVDTPEQTLDVVAAATQTREGDKVRPEASERERRQTQRGERGRDTARETDRPTRPEPKADRPSEAGLNPVSAAQQTEVEAPAVDPSSSFRDTVHEVIAGPARAKRVGHETGRAPEEAAALVAARTADTPSAAQTVATSAPQSEVLLAQAAQSVASSALADRQFSRIGEDLHDAALHRFTQVGQRAGGQTAAVSLKQEQEVDLSSRLGLDTPLAIKVDVESEQAKMRAMPHQSLNGAAVMAELGTTDSDSNPFSQPFGRSGDNIGAEQRAPTHGALLNDRALIAANANDFGQMVRAQGALMAAQQAAQAPAEAKPLLPSEAIQLNGTAAPSGPSQLSQTARANPTTAARQPERPQPPAEQIAVKIRQAVGEGLDKINIKLNPAHLGRVEVRLEIKDGHINATVLAERKETLDLLQKDARGLERALLDAGLRTDIQSLSFGLRGDGQRHVDVGRERRQGAFGRASRMDGGIDRDERVALKSNNNGRSLRVSGGVDIRV